MTYRTYGITGIWTDKLSCLNGYKTHRMDFRFHTVFLFAFLLSIKRHEHSHCVLSPVAPCIIRNSYRKRIGRFRLIKAVGLIVVFKPYRLNFQPCPSGSSVSGSHTVILPPRLSAKDSTLPLSASSKQYTSGPLLIAAIPLTAGIFTEGYTK